jgi:hypothetical protein
MRGLVNAPDHTPSAARAGRLLWQSVTVGGSSATLAEHPEFTAKCDTVAKRGRPKIEVTEEQVQRARELLGRYLHRSRVVGLLTKEFSVGRPHAAAMVDRAVAEFRAELESKGPVDLLTLTTAGLLNVAGADDAKPRDRVGALANLVRLLGLRAVFKDMADADDVDKLLGDILARRAARGGMTPDPGPDGITRPPLV